jgi:hypothetical protein
MGTGRGGEWGGKPGICTTPGFLEKIEIQVENENQVLIINI